MKKVIKQINKHTICIVPKSTNESGCITTPGHKENNVSLLQVGLSKNNSV